MYLTWVWKVGMDIFFYYKLCVKEATVFFFFFLKGNIIFKEIKKTEILHIFPPKSDDFKITDNRLWIPYRPEWLSRVFTLVIQDLFKILTNYKAIRYAFWVPLDFRYSKKENKNIDDNDTKSQNAHFDKTFIISRSYIKYCRLMKQLDCWPFCTNGRKRNAVNIKCLYK